MSLTRNCFLMCLAITFSSAATSPAQDHAGVVAEQVVDPMEDLAVLAWGDPTERYPYLSSASIADSYRSAAACYEGPVSCKPTRIGRWIERTKSVYAGSPELFCERPFGQGIRQQFDAHIVAGMAAQCVLYRYDFEPLGTATSNELSRRGQGRLQEILPRLQTSSHRLVIESTGIYEQDLARRQHVLDVMSLWNSQIPPQQVVVQTSTGRGMSGDEALTTYYSMLNRSGSAASQSTSNSASTGASVGVPATR